MSHPNGPRTGRPPTFAPRALIATPHTLASAAGLDILRRGGSAVDAAIAASAVLCVAYPHMAGLGGDGFWLVWHPSDRRVRALDACGPAARLATREYYAERGHRDVIPDRGAAAALTVPGAVDGWREAHERHGRLDWDALFQDAIRYARDGVPVGGSLADWSARDVPVLSRHPRAAGIFLPRGNAPREGDLLRQPDLARSLERLATHGARTGFYEGETAERICDALAPEGSPLRPDDFADFRAGWVEPIATTYRGYTVVGFPPPTQGFAALQVLNLIEGYDVAAWGDGTADYYHHMAEAVKVAFADRDAWLTDPAFVDIPLDRLLAKEYADQRRALIERGSALVREHVRPGIPFDPAAFRAGGTTRHAVAASGGDDAPERGTGARRRRAPGGDTVYFCVVDEDGLAVSAIQSIYYDFGAAVVGGETGILLQNRGSFFQLDEAHPNRLEPGKRTFHTLMPAMLLRGDAPHLVFGAMGGEGQPQTHAALVSRIVDFGYDVQQAIEAPRWRVGPTWGKESHDLALEGRIPGEVARELERRGQPVRMLADWAHSMGHAQAIRIHRDRGVLEGGADPRGDGAALGF